MWVLVCEARAYYAYASSNVLLVEVLRLRCHYVHPTTFNQVPIISIMVSSEWSIEWPCTFVYFVLLEHWNMVCYYNQELVRVEGTRSSLHGVHGKLYYYLLQPTADDLH